jgi:acyl carrier protein
MFTPDEEQDWPMGDYQDILNQLCEIIKPSVKDGRQLEEDTDLVADLGLDSLKVMTLVEEVEDQFDISIPLNILANVRTIKDFALQLQQLTEEG